MELPQAQDVDAGPDWLTWVTPHGDESLAVSTWADEMLTGFRGAGLEIEKRTIEGYKGWSTEGFSWGRRSDGQMTRLSGPATSLWWRQLASLSGHPTRLDLQATFKYEQSISNTLPTSVATIPRSRSTRGRRKKGSLNASTTGAFQVTWGHRATDEYLKWYDKGVEKKWAKPGMMMRVELEVKGALAALHLAGMKQSACPAYYAFSEVSSSLQRVSGLSSPAPMHSVRLAAATPQLSRSMEAERAWWTRQVAPKLRGMIARGRQQLVWELLAETVGVDFPMPDGWQGATPNEGD